MAKKKSKIECPCQECRQNRLYCHLKLAPHTPVPRGLRLEPRQVGAGSGEWFDLQCQRNLILLAGGRVQ